jgi:dihydroorotate dehydrogenase electron transfer subunit
VLEAPHCAKSLRPGQFIHLRLTGDSMHLLRRPLSVCAVDVSAGHIELLIQVKGEGTRLLVAARPGQVLDAIGPLGRGWQPPEGVRRALLVGGGIGCAPLAPLSRQLAVQGVEQHFIMGARDAALMDALGVLTLGKHQSIAPHPVMASHPVIAGLTRNLVLESAGGLRVKPAMTEEIGTSLGVDASGVATGSSLLHLVTDDGSVGRKGFTTDIARELLATGGFDYLATCGPEPMQRILADLAYAAGTPCEVSLERRMACGIGACLSCVVDTTEGKKRACVNGPVFDAREVLWS